MYRLSYISAYNISIVKNLQYLQNTYSNDILKSLFYSTFLTFYMSAFSQQDFTYIIVTTSQTEM